MDSEHEHATGARGVRPGCRKVEEPKLVSRQSFLLTVLTFFMLFQPCSLNNCLMMAKDELETVLDLDSRRLDTLRKLVSTHTNSHMTVINMLVYVRLDD